MAGAITRGARDLIGAMQEKKRKSEKQQRELASFDRFSQTLGGVVSDDFAPDLQRVVEQTRSSVEAGDIDSQKALDRVTTLAEFIQEQRQATKPVTETKEFELFQAKEAEKKRLARKEKESEFTKNVKTISGDISDLFSTFTEIPLNVRGPLAGRTLGQLERITQDVPQVADYLDSREFFMSNIARSLGGERGVLTDRDIRRVQQFFPQIHDTEEVANRKMNRMKRFISNRIRQKGTPEDLAVFDTEFKIPGVTDSKPKESDEEKRRRLIEAIRSKRGEA